jgi:hypothetical protein
MPFTVTELPEIAFNFPELILKPAIELLLVVLLFRI